MAAGRAAPPGMFIPLCEESVPPTSTSQSTPSASGSRDPQADRAVGEVDELVLAQVGDARPGDRDRLAVALDLARGQGHVHAGLELGEVVAQLADPQLRPGQVAEDRDLAADPLRRRRGSSRSSRACLSGPAWEKLRRKTSAPASISCSSTPGPSSPARPWR